MDMENEILTGSVIGDEGVLALEELARACSAEAEWIVELVAVGVLEPQGTEASRWRFRAADSADRSVTRSPETGRSGCGLGAGRRGRPGTGLVRQPVPRALPVRALVHEQTVSFV